MNSVNVERGRAVRRSLLAIAKLCIEQDKPLPTYAVLSGVVGCDRVRLWHHVRLLRTHGALTVRRGHGSRLHVQEVRL